MNDQSGSHAPQRVRTSIRRFRGQATRATPDLDRLTTKRTEWLAFGSMALVGVWFAFATPASAQGQTEACTSEQASAGACDAGPEIASGAASTDEQSLTITGTRIRRPNLESNIPITSISGEDLTAQGDLNIGEALEDLPSLRSTFNQANSNFPGVTGLNILDLRGLGIERTLVLVNGRRHVTARPGAFLVDVNTIPVDLIERVDVITGGNSAVYGSDAIAGVVNFVLRRDFDGIRMRGQGGVSQQGDRGTQFVALTAGRNFLGNRANITISLEYSHSRALYFADRPRLTGAFDGRCGINLAEFTIGEPAVGDGVPDFQFFCGLRSGAASSGGTILANASAALCQNPNAFPLATGNARCLNFGTPQGQPRIFRWDRGGVLLQDTLAFDFRPFGSGSVISDPNSPVPGSTIVDTQQLLPGFDRYAANLVAHLDLSNALHSFLEVKYVRTFARQESQPSFFQQTFPQFFGAGRGIRCDNPFLDPQDIATLQTIGRCLGGATSAETLPVARINVDFGLRSELAERDTWRLVGGVRGDFNTDWSYEVAFNYGRFDTHADELNNLVGFDLAGNPAGFLLAVDATRDASGRIVCRVNADADPANDAPGCIPIDLFGLGRPSRAAIDFVNTTSFYDTEARQYNAIAYVNGDLSDLFELPGGPINFVLGGEWRRETAFQQADPLSASGGTFFGIVPTWRPPAFEVVEAFGELQVPILRDVPLAHELTLAAAARYSDYNSAADTTVAYNLNGSYAPAPGLRFRANFSRAVRIPTLVDQFLPSSRSSGFLRDPCDVLFINNGPNRAANCAAAGIPPGFVNTFARTQTIGITISGNPALEEETGQSLTIGAIFTPRWVPGLNITVDYYRIRVENLIAQLGGQTILDSCYDLPSLDNQFCPLITRNPDGTFAEIIAAAVNFQRQEADGIDMEVIYRRRFDNGHRLDLRGIATYVIKRNNFISPTDPGFSDRQLGELGDPRWAANLAITYGIGPFDLRYAFNYVGRQTIGPYEFYFPHQGRPPINADFTREIWIPDILYHAARLSMRVGENSAFYLGVDNIFDTPPPLDQVDVRAFRVGAASDPVGRYFYAGATVDF